LVLRQTTTSLEHLMHTAQSAAPERILIIDDVPRNLQVADLILRNAGYEVTGCLWASEGLDRFRERPFDLVLLDILMPKTDGFETARLLRELPEGRHTPLVFLTAMDEGAVHQRALDAGVDDLLNKPINPTELLMRVRSLMRVARLRREMQESYDLIAQQRNELIRIQGQKQELINLIVHDLKNPLAVIMANAGFLAHEESGVGASEVQETARDIQGSAEVMFRMVTNMLDVSRDEEGELPLRAVPTDLQELLALVAGAMGRRFEQALRRCEVRVDPGLPKLQVDPELIRRLIENLLDNCLKYTPSGSTVFVSASSGPGGFVELRISDEGAGIPNDQKHRVFEKFARLERDGDMPTRSSQGLGLSFCRLAVEAHGGRIWIEDRKPRGTSFCVTLPVAGQPVGTAARVEGTVLPLRRVSSQVP
jgi:two-component system sensor histidine kinase/response regulator